MRLTIRDTKVEVGNYVSWSATIFSFAPLVQQQARSTADGSLFCCDPAPSHDLLPRSLGHVISARLFLS